VRGAGAESRAVPTWTLVPTAAPEAWSAHAVPRACRWLMPGVGAAMAWLRASGLGPGSRLGVGPANSPALAALLQAAPLAGVTLVLINHRLHPEERRRQVASARLDRLLEDDLPEAFADAPLGAPTPLGDDQAMLVLFTSGTTGAAKAARLTRGAIDAAVGAAVARLALRREDGWLACLPLDHIGGAMTVLRAGACGMRVLLMDRFDAAQADAALERVDGVSVVPTMLRRLVAERAGRPWPARLRRVLTGGGPLDPALASAAAASGIEPSQTYGLTESASMATMADDGEDAGEPLPGLGLRIAEPQDDGVGRIELRGPMLFAGYERDGVLVEPRAADAWFDTGDLGVLDRRGRLSVRCRRTDLILSGGENVYPAQVEAALMRHPGIAEAAVFGLADPEWGQSVAALLVARAAPLPDAAVTAHAGETLAPFQRPRHWRWLSDLPRTASGKVVRVGLGDAFASASAAQNRCQVIARLDSPDRMTVPSIVSEEIDGIRAISFQRDERGQANQEMVRLYFSNEFLKSTSGVKNLVIDLTGVISLDSAALGPLVQKLREVHDLDGRMALAGVVSPALKEIFALTRFDKVFPMYPSRQEAMSALAGAR